MCTGGSQKCIDGSHGVKYSSIPQNKYVGYSNNDVWADFEELKAGTKTLKDLAAHFGNGEKDMWYLGMDVDYQGW